MDKNFKAINEPIIDFEPGSEHRKLLLEEIERQSSRQKDIPIIINGKEKCSKENPVFLWEELLVILGENLVCVCVCV